MKISRWAKRILALVAILALAGCATPRIDWTARMGHYSYDQAVKDLGPPDRYAKLTDGTIVAEWLTHQTQPFYPGPYGAAGPLPPTPYVGVYAPNYFMRLTFAPDGLLEAYKDVMR